MAAAHGALMTSEQFEELDRLAGRLAERVRLELVGGTVLAKAAPDDEHGRIVRWLSRFFAVAKPGTVLHLWQCLTVGYHRSGRAVPDGVLAEAGAFSGQPQWAAPDPVLLAVEITPGQQCIQHRDDVDKAAIYAATGIPVYLLVDRARTEVTVFSCPGDERYHKRTTVSFGTGVELPEPVGVALDTEPLKAWV